MKKIKRKKVLRFIRKAVEQLPPQEYKTYHKYNSPQWEKDEEGKDVYRFGYIGSHQVNHKRRCMHLYDKLGMKGISAYLQFYGFQITEKAA